MHKNKQLYFIVLVALLFGVSCQKKEALKQPNIVYVFADQWRATSVGYNDNKTIKTPNIDQLSVKGINFANCVSVQPVCTPYRASLMTGRYPTSTGMFLNDLHLPSEELCIAEIYKEAGYNTAYIGKWHLDGHGRQAFIPRERRQGWDYWKAAECDHNNHRSHYYTGDSDEKNFWDKYDVFAQTEDASNYIKEHANDENPFILMLSYGPPHPASPKALKKYRDMYPKEEIVVPGNVPEDKRDKAKEELKNYYALGTIIDENIGNLLQTLDESGIADNTIFVFTSDHGGMIYAHGWNRARKQVAWNESSHVPFLLRYPDAHGQEGRVVETPINTPDIPATLLGLSGIKLPESLEGEDVSQLVKEDTEMEERSVLFMSPAPFNGAGEAYRALRTSRYTYTRKYNGDRLLFDNVNDPLELNNLIDDADYTSVVDELEVKLQGHLNEIGDDFRAPESYIEEYGYELGAKNEIPYKGDAKVQSPKPLSCK